MDKQTIDKYKKAGEIAKEVKQYARSITKEGVSYLEIAEKIESKICQLGGEVAWPVDISVNDLAAHYSPTHQDKSVLKKGDLAKIDIGVHIDGHIADTATSISIGADKENKALIDASEAALSAAINLAKPGTKLAEIGAAIQQEIESRRFKSVRNLAGHTLEVYEIHAGISIPNVEIGGTAELKEGMVIAIEPFATTGEGRVVDGKGSEIYELAQARSLRTNRDVLEHIILKYKTLPFAKRQLVKRFGALKASLAIRQMLAQKIIREYPVLREKAKGKVAQAEHTILILKKPILIT